jgi:hypothetical protein
VKGSGGFDPFTRYVASLRPPRRESKGKVALDEKIYCSVPFRDSDNNQSRTGSLQLTGVGEYSLPPLEKPATRRSGWQNSGAAACRGLRVNPKFCEGGHCIASVVFSRRDARILRSPRAVSEAPRKEARSLLVSAGAFDTDFMRHRRTTWHENALQ